MVFANATYLWGLLGLLIPIAIHLWSRKKVLTIKVGSIKLLQESEPKQTSSIHINEWWLLLLRLFMLTLLVFIMAGPSLKKKVKNLPVTYIIEPSLLKEEQISSFLDSVSDDAIRVLAKNFPLLEDYQGNNQDEVIPYWQLAQNMYTIPSDSVIVFAKGLIKGIRGKRPLISANTKWIVLESQNEVLTPIKAVQKQNQAFIKTAISNANSFTYKTDTIPFNDSKVLLNNEKDSIQILNTTNRNWLKLHQQSAIQVGIILHDTLQQQIFYLERSLMAISKFIDQPIVINKSSANITFSELTALVVDAIELVPDDFLGTVLVYKPNGLQNNLIVPGHKMYEYYLTSPLNSENIVGEQLGEKLLKLLSVTNSDIGKLEMTDQRIISGVELQPVYQKPSKLKRRSISKDLTMLLWLLFLASVIIERILSRVRKQ